MKEITTHLFGLFCFAAASSVGYAQSAPATPATGQAAAAPSREPVLQKPAAVAEPPDGLTMRKGKTYFMKNLNATMLDNKLELSEGIVAWPNGEVQLKDGRKVQLQEGQILSLQGQLLPLSPHAGIQWHSGTTSTTGTSSNGSGANPLGARPTGQGAEISLGGSGPNATKDKSHYKTPGDDAEKNKK